MRLLNESMSVIVTSRQIYPDFACSPKQEQEATATPKENEHPSGHLPAGPCAGSMQAGMPGQEDTATKLKKGKGVGSSPVTMIWSPVASGLVPRPPCSWTSPSSTLKVASPEYSQAW